MTILRMILVAYGYPEMNYLAVTTAMKCAGWFSVHLAEGSIYPVIHIPSLDYSKTS